MAALLKVAALVARELASPLLATLAGGLICLAAIGCILALRPDQLAEIKRQLGFPGVFGAVLGQLNSIGGILAHAPSLLAFTNPTVNSYHRLVPGFEAPVNLVYSARKAPPRPGRDALCSVA